MGRLFAAQICTDFLIVVIIQIRLDADVLTCFIQPCDNIAMNTCTVVDVRTFYDLGFQFLPVLTSTQR